MGVSGSVWSFVSEKNSHNSSRVSGRVLKEMLRRDD